MTSALNSIAVAAFPIGGLAIGFLGYSWAPAVFLALILFQWLLMFATYSVIPKETNESVGGLGTFIGFWTYILYFAPAIAAVTTPLVLPRTNITDHRILAAYVAIPLLLVNSNMVSSSAPQESRNRTMAIAIFINVILPLVAYYYFALR